MPRQGRVVLPNRPHHVIQRGHNKHTVFHTDAECVAYLRNLGEWKRILGCQIYAYCLMTNHVHLIINPGANAGSLALLMKRVAGRQTRAVNAQQGRSGTLWEGRYKSSPIETEAYLLACGRYVELNPVRARMVKRPEEYRWSSYRTRAGLSAWDWLDPDPCYLGLGRSAAERARRYKEWTRAAIPDGEWERIRHAIQRGQLTGGERFIALAAQRLGRRVEFRGRGRPRKA